MTPELEKAIARYDAAVASLGGCTDGACVVKRPTGMHTNGGCHCSFDKIKAHRMMQAGQQLRAALPTIVSSEMKDGHLHPLPMCPPDECCGGGCHED